MAENEYLSYHATAAEALDGECGPNGVTDVIQQAREALDPKWTRPMQETVSLMHSALRAVVEAADAGYLIDARRIEALAEKGIAIIPEGRSRMHKWEVWHGEIVATASTFADALAAAERDHKTVLLED